MFQSALLQCLVMFGNMNLASKASCLATLNPFRSTLFHAFQSSYVISAQLYAYIYMLLAVTCAQLDACNYMHLTAAMCKLCKGCVPCVSEFANAIWLCISSANHLCHLILFLM